MKNFRLLIAALALLTSFSACKKDDAPVKPTEKTTAEKISSASGKRWAITSVKAKYTVSGQQREDDAKDYYFDDCEQDNLMVLFSNKKVETREGAIRCGTSDLASTGNWELKNQDKEMHLTTNGNTIYFNLVEVTENTLKAEFPDTYPLTNGTEIEGITTLIYTAQ